MTILPYRAMDKSNRILGTGNLRYEFERLYAMDPAPWRYATSLFEEGKHACTLEHRTVFENQKGSPRGPNHDSP